MPRAGFEPDSVAYAGEVIAANDAKPRRDATGPTVTVGVGLRVSRLNVGDLP